MPSKEEKDLDSAITKLSDFHTLGEELRKVLRLSPGGYARDGELRKAAAAAGKKMKVKVTDERARKAIEFAKKFSDVQLYKLVTRCLKNGFCPEVGTIIRLLPLKLQERNRLLTQVIKNRWTKADLDAELERLKPAKDPGVHKRRGRMPKAAKSIEALSGRANVNAREYTHVLEVLGEEDANYKLSSAQKKELEKLIKLLRKIGKWV